MVLVHAPETVVNLEVPKDILASFGVLETPRDGAEQLGLVQHELLNAVKDCRTSHALLGMAENERSNSMLGVEDRAIYAGEEVNTDYLSYSRSFREMARSAEQTIEHKIDELIELPYIQSGEFFGKLDGHPVEYYKNDKDGKFLHGIHYLLLTHPEQVEVAQAFAEYAVKGLVKKGRYDILGSKDFQKTLDKFIGNYSEGKDRKKLRDASVLWFVNRSYRRIENQMDVGALDSENVAHVENEVNGKYGGLVSSNTYRQVFKIFSQLVRYEKTHQLEDLDKIRDSRLITGERGLLRIVNGDKVSNSNDQQGRMLLLSLDNVGENTAESILDYVQDYPAASRSITGKLPAGLHTFLDRHNRLDLLDKSKYNWPTPPAASFPAPSILLENQLNVYQYAVRCIEKGWDIPDDISILPIGTIRRLEQKYKDIHRGWSAPQPRLSDRKVIEDKPWEDFYKPHVLQGLLGMLKPGKL